jgi:N-acylneuraminate cytidylyltransferase
VGVTAIIPARGGSKGLPGKNLAKVGGFSLISRTIIMCGSSNYISNVVVSTDSSEIALEAKNYGAKVVLRPSELSSDQSKSEDAIQHAIVSAGISSNIIAFLECTSPFIYHADLDTAVEMVEKEQCDVAFSVVESSVQLWQKSASGFYYPFGGHEPIQTLRQERKTVFEETGAFYVFKKDKFLEKRNRFCGNALGVPVSSLHKFEIDTKDDLILARSLAALLDSELGYFRGPFENLAR